MIEIKKVLDKKDLVSFVKFPFKLYKESKYWVPPIIDQEINSFNKDLNPNLKNSDVEFSECFINKCNNYANMLSSDKKTQFMKKLTDKNIL